MASKMGSMPPRGEPLDFVSPKSSPSSPRRRGPPSQSRGSPQSREYSDTATSPRMTRKTDPDAVRALALNPTFPTLSYLSVYTTRTRIYVVGCSEEPPGGMNAEYRVLKIDRTHSNTLDLTDDGVRYTQKEIQELLLMIDAGSGEKRFVENSINAYGLMGFVRFLQGYYMILITERRKVMQLGKHYIYKIEATMTVSVGPVKKGQSHDPLEARYLKAFQNVDTSSNFYFSYTYDLTRPLQANMHIPTPAEAARREPLKPRLINPIADFVWNGFLAEPYVQEVHDHWKINIIHGYVTQQCLHVFGRQIFVALIARRSREFAGTRFLKRGATASGNPANNVETEQIAFDASNLDHLSGLYTSFLQIRASVPSYWSQDISTKIKPPIKIDRRDPFASAAALHFDELLQKYGFPLIVLNLVKKKEKKKREAILSAELTQSIDYLNQFLSEQRKIEHTPWDMHRTAKSKDGNVLESLSQIGKRAMMRTGFFHAGPELNCNRIHDDGAPTIGGIGYDDNGTPGRNQCGILRVNCVDCLDRTNTAQFMFGLNALGNQLYALGVIEAPTQLSFDCAAFHLLEEMFEDHGDTLALQYGGSNLVNRIQTYRKTSPWTVGSRDILNTVSRYYSNSFTDVEKQEAINVFLGKFRPANCKDNIWELDTDHMLHYPHLRTGRFGIEPVANYMQWCHLGEGDLADIADFRNRPTNRLVDIPPLYANSVSPAQIYEDDRDSSSAASALPAAPVTVFVTPAADSIEDGDTAVDRDLSATKDSENDDMDDMSPQLLAVLNPSPDSRKAFVVRPLPSLEVFRCHDIVDLKQKIVEFYQLGSGIKDKAHIKFKAPSSGTIDSIANLVSFLAGESVMSLETIAKNTSVSVLASLMIELNAEENVFSLLNPAAARLDYIEIRRVIVKELNVTHSKFDKQVKQMVASWKAKKKSPDDFNIAALLIAGRLGCHFRPSTIIPKPPAQKQENRCQDAMFGEFYEVGQLTSFDDDRTFALQMAAAGRVAGCVGVGPFSPTRSPMGGVAVSQAGAKSPSPSVNESNLFHKSPFGIPREEEVDSDQDEFEETLNPGLFFDNGRASVAKVAAPDATVIREDTELADLPSAVELYGVGIARPSEIDIALFSRYTNLDGFLEGEDYFVPPNISAAVHPNTADFESEYTVVDHPFHVSSPARRDHKPVAWRASAKCSTISLSLFSSDAESLKRVQPRFPTAFSAVPSESLSMYQQFAPDLTVEPTPSIVEVSA